MRYFKVTDSQMRSLYFDYYHGKGVQYELGKTVRPVVGKLFCYSLDHLRYYGFPEYTVEGRYPGRRLFECECLSPIVRRTYVKLLRSLSSEIIGRTYRSVREYDMLEVEAVFAQGIKLVREITNEELEVIIKERY